MLLYGEYNIPYATVPTVDVGQTFVFQLRSTDNSAVLASYTPYDNPYYHSGYGKGAFSFYFPASSAPVWSSAYVIRVQEVTGQFAAVSKFDTTMTGGDYSALNTQAANQQELAEKIATIATDLSSQWGTALVNTSGTTTFTATGEAYFRNVFPNLQTMAAELFAIQFTGLDYTDGSWATTQFDTYANQFDGTWVGDGVTAGGHMFGMPGQAFVGFFWMLPLMIGAVILSALKWGQSTPGLMVDAALLMMGALMGFVPIGIFAFVYQLLGVYLGYIWLFKGSNNWLNFLAFSWLISTLICLIIEGAFFGSAQTGILAGLSVFNHYDFAGIITVPVINFDFWQSIVRLLTWDYSFYQGGYSILRLFFVASLTPGAVWAIVQACLWLWGNIVSKLVPNLIP